IASNITPGLSDRILTDTGMNQEVVTYPDIILQVGANENQTFAIELFDARVENLGIDDVDVSDRAGAQLAISKLDHAISMVSSERAKFGAYQNALEHIAANVSNSKLNLTAAESQIRDADMALLMTDFTKKNILNQSATAMLAQANQWPQGILQLLS
ncbi:flagellin, partial [Halalkalibacter okhensis]|uniref:flagellin n=1 Tax=Halalkalibacter okhensis TaxID=333138 RepID=UPI0023517F33